MNKYDCREFVGVCLMIKYLLIVTDISIIISVVYDAKKLTNIIIRFYVNAMLIIPYAFIIVDY